MLKSFWDVLRLYNDPPLYNCAGLKQIVEREEQEQIESSHTLPNEFHDNIQPNPNTSPNNTMSSPPFIQLPPHEPIHITIDTPISSTITISYVVP
jgi:hypothetical protein